MRFSLAKHMVHMAYQNIPLALPKYLPLSKMRCDTGGLTYGESEAGKFRLGGRLLKAIA